MPKPATKPRRSEPFAPGRLPAGRAHARADVRGDPAQEARLLRQGSGSARGPVRRTGDPGRPVHPAGDRAAAAAICRVRRGSLDQDALPGFGRLFDLRDGRALSLAAGAGRRAGAGDPVHLPQSQSTRPTLAPISWRLARSGQLPGGPPVRRRAGGRRGNLVPGISPAPACHLAQRDRSHVGRSTRRMGIRRSNRK